MILGYIDGGTAAAIAAIATGGLAGAKVGLQSMFYRFKSKKEAPDHATDTDGAAVGDTHGAAVAPDPQESADQPVEADHVAP